MQHRPTSQTLDGNSLAVAQGAFYAVAGAWPLASLGTFEAITGPKTDHWLVKTVGTVVGVVGASLALAGLRHRTTADLAVLGAGAAAGLAAIDLVYVARGRISAVYLLDAIVEGGIVACWALSRLGRAR